MKEYKLAKGWRIFIYIFTPPLIALFVGLAIMPFTPASEGISPKAAWFFIPLSLVMVVVMTLGLLDTIKGKVIIDGNKIAKKGVWAPRELSFQEIKGFTVNEHYIIIEPNVTHKKKIKISLAYQKTQEIIAWLAYDHPDLDEVNNETETLEIIANEQYGDTRAERTLQLEKAKQVAKYVNFAGIAVGAWAFLYPYPYEYMLLACIIVPLIAIVILKVYKGLIRIDAGKGSAYPAVTSGFAGPIVGLIWRAINDYNIFDYTNCWIPAGVITVGLMRLLIAVQKGFNLKEARHRWFVVGFLFLSFAYGYGAVITLNCYYDRSVPEIYPTTVVDKKTSSGKTTSYYLYLSPWGKVTEVDKIDVPRSLYDSIEKDDPVKVLFRKGRFNIPWLRIIK